MKKSVVKYILFIPFLVALQLNCFAQNREEQGISISTNTVSNIDYFNGQLRPAVGVHNIQVMRANREHPELADGFGWTYNHAAMLSYWNNTFYLEYLSCEKSEHVPPGQTLLCTSKDGYNWSKPMVIFPQYEIPEGTMKKGTDEKSATIHMPTDILNTASQSVLSKPTPKGMKAVMHQRMGFYTAKSGRHYILAFYGISIDVDYPNDGKGIGRVIREIRKDGTFGDIFFLRYNASQGWNEKNTRYLFYKSGKDKGIVHDCDEILANKLMMMQMWEENDRGDPLIPLNETLKAFCYYHLPNGSVMGLWKWAKSAISIDEGNTWGPRTDVPGLVTDGGKIWGQRTSDGKFATIYNPTASWRWPSAISTSTDGYHYTNLLCLHGEVSQPRYTGGYKDFGPAYLRGIVEGNGTPPDNNMWVAYSLSKEDIWAACVPVPITDSVTEPVNDVFNELPDGSELKFWNTYSPLWSPVSIEKSADGIKCLTLTDKEPNDYAKAQRVFPKSKNFKVEFELMPVAGHNGTLEIELQDAKSMSAFKIVIDKDGSIGFTDGKATFKKFETYQQTEWYKFVITCANGKYSISVNDKPAVPVYAVFATLPIERLVFRTGPERKCLGISTPYPYHDLPNVSEPLANPAKYQIKYVKTSNL